MKCKLYAIFVLNVFKEYILPDLYITLNLI